MKIERFNEINKQNDTSISSKIPLKYYKLATKMATSECVPLSVLWRRFIINGLLEWAKNVKTEEVKNVKTND